jgi:RHS repeat-associated protein
MADALANSGPSTPDRYSFTARELDSVTALQYNRVRCFDPTPGRWLTEEPAGFGLDATPAPGADQTL